jgi:tRNA(adenine34) deaminase
MASCPSLDGRLRDLPKALFIVFGSLTGVRKYCVMSTERYFLESAMQEAEHAYNAGTYPIGAVIVDPGGEIIGRGCNHVYWRGDYTWHAEMEAIRDAGCRLMKKPNFNACTLYTTMEPCLMCCGAILIARIARVIWVMDDNLYGALRRLCDKNHCQNGTMQKSEAELSFAKSCTISSESSEEEMVRPGYFPESFGLSSMNAEELASPQLLPSGYAEKIATLSILPADDHELAQRMRNLMNKWDAAKEARLEHWR